MKTAAVWLGDDPIIENNNDAVVGFCSDEAPNALSKFQDRFRQGVFCERVAAAFLQSSESAQRQRV
jgi:hypothetical protein